MRTIELSICALLLVAGAGWAAWLLSGDRPDAMSVGVLATALVSASPVSPGGSSQRKAVASAARRSASGRRRKPRGSVIGDASCFTGSDVYAERACDGDVGRVETSGTYAPAPLGDAEP